MDTKMNWYDRKHKGIFYFCIIQLFISQVNKCFVLKEAYNLAWKNTYRKTGKNTINCNLLVAILLHYIMFTGNSVDKINSYK
jgi:hypothetical protein